MVRAFVACGDDRAWDVKRKTDSDHGTAERSVVAGVREADDEAVGQLRSAIRYDVVAPIHSIMERRTGNADRSRALARARCVIVGSEVAVCQRRRAARMRPVDVM